jgi:hypothetical protein
MTGNLGVFASGVSVNLEIILRVFCSIFYALLIRFLGKSKHTVTSLFTGGLRYDAEHTALPRMRPLPG